MLKFKFRRGLSAEWALPKGTYTTAATNLTIVLPGFPVFVTGGIAARQQELKYTREQ